MQTAILLTQKGSNSVITPSMSKVPQQHKFIDLSDYGRPVAIKIALRFEHTFMTPIKVTWLFIVAGLFAVVCMYFGYFWLAFFFLILKSILDAADGELARVKNTPSYTGRYFDSIADILLNALLIATIYYLTNSSVVLSLLAFLGIQLQGTLYNYYYVILRNKVDGDTTSQIFERSIPTALPGEKQRNVSALFKIYRSLYGIFDFIIYRLDRKAPQGKIPPKWFMTALSTFGLGFQLLLIGLMLVAGFIDYIIPFFIAYTGMIFVFIMIRKVHNKKS